MRVLVCGGRDYADEDVFATVMARLHARTPVTVVIHGAATGADTLADRWAVYHTLPIIRFPADWRSLGRAAGPIRNEHMLGAGRPELVVAFPGGRGTADMRRRALRARIPVAEVTPLGVVTGFGRRFFGDASTKGQNDE